MNSNELKQFIQLELKDRWRKWNPTDTEIKDIKAWFEPFTIGQASKAAMQVKQEQITDKWEPDISKILSICKRMEQSGKSTTHVSTTAVWDDGFWKDFQYPMPGLVEVDAERGDAIRHEILRYLIDGRHFMEHGLENIEVFVGIENRGKAMELSEQRRQGRRNDTLPSVPQEPIKDRY